MSEKQAKTFDPIWEEKYSQGHAERAPWDTVVSFVFRKRPRDRGFADIKLLEIGCGTGSNLRFFAGEGFDVAGIDASESAIKTAQKFFDHDGLPGDLRIADFTKLPYTDNSFDMAIDRGALTCAGISTQKKAIAEVHRVLKPGGHFLYTPFANTHSSRATGKPGPDGVTLDITGGTLTGVGQIYFSSKEEIEQIFSSGWKLSSMEYETREEKLGEGSLHSSWRVVAEKI